MNIIIRFPDEETRLSALGKLVPRFPGKAWANGEVMVPELALAYLATEGFRFSVVGPATYERVAALRDSVAAAV